MTRIERGFAEPVKDPLGQALFLDSDPPSFLSDLQDDAPELPGPMTTSSYVLRAGLGERRRRALAWLAAGVLLGASAAGLGAATLWSRVSQPIADRAPAIAKAPALTVAYDAVQPDAQATAELKARLLGTPAPVPGVAAEAPAYVVVSDDDRLDPAAE
jgi:hypothetical protein